MRLAIFWNDILHYHAARLAAIFEMAEEEGHEVYAYALSPRSPELPVGGYHGLLGDKILLLSDCSEGTGPYSRQSKRQLLAALDRDKPDGVAIIGYDGKVSRAALGWCRRHYRGAVLMFESQEIDKPRFLVPELVKKGLLFCFDSVFCSGSRQKAYANLLGMPDERIFQKYATVGNSFWEEWAKVVKTDEQKWRQELNLPAKFFLSVGRFIPKKNFSGLIEAYSQYLQHVEGEPWSLVIAGDGELRERLQNQIEQLGVSRWVHLPGYLRVDDLAKIYALATTFILPSSHYEQWGLVVNEAMAASLPVFVSDICGCADDLVMDGVNGFRFDPENLGQLAELMLQATGGSFDLEKMGEKSCHLIQQHYSPAVFAENLMSAADTAIKHAKTRRFNLWLPARYWI